MIRHSASVVVQETEPFLEFKMSVETALSEALAALDLQTCSADVLQGVLKSCVDGLRTKPRLSLASLDVVDQRYGQKTPMSHSLTICCKAAIQRGVCAQLAVQAWLLLALATGQSELILELALTLMSAPQASLEPAVVRVSHNLLSLLREVAEIRSRCAERALGQAGVHRLPVAATPEPAQQFLTSAAFDATLARGAAKADDVRIASNGRSVSMRADVSYAVCLTSLHLPGYSPEVGLSPRTVVSASWTFTVENDNSAAYTCIGMAMRPISEVQYDRCTELWGIRAYNGYQYSQGKGESKDGKEYKLNKGDTVRFDLDFAESGGCLKVYINGKLKGTPFRNIRDCIRDREVYPAVALYDSSNQPAAAIAISAVSAVLLPTREQLEAAARSSATGSDSSSVGMQRVIALPSLLEHHASMEHKCSLGRGGALGWGTAPEGCDAAYIQGQLHRQGLAMYPKAGPHSYGGESQPHASTEVAKMSSLLDNARKETEAMFSNATTAVWALNGEYDSFSGSVCLCDLPVPDDFSDPRGRARGLAPDATGDSLPAGNACSPVHFEIWLDGQRVWQSGPVTSTRVTPRPFRVSALGCRVLRLVVYCEGHNANAPALWVEPLLMHKTEWYCTCGWRNERFPMQCAMCGCGRGKANPFPSSASSLDWVPALDRNGQPVNGRQGGRSAVDAKTTAKALAAWAGTMHGLSHCLLEYVIVCLVELARARQAVHIVRMGAATQGADSASNTMGNNFLDDHVRAVCADVEQGWYMHVLHDSVVSATDRPSVLALLRTKLTETVRLDASRSSQYVIQTIDQRLCGLSLSPEPVRPVLPTSGRPAMVPSSDAGTLQHEQGKLPGSAAVSSSDVSNTPGWLVELDVPWPLDVTTTQGAVIAVETFLIQLHLEAQQAGMHCALYGSWPGKVYILIAIPFPGDDGVRRLRVLIDELSASVRKTVGASTAMPDTQAALAPAVAPSTVPKSPYEVATHARSGIAFLRLEYRGILEGRFTGAFDAVDGSSTQTQRAREEEALAFYLLDKSTRFAFGEWADTDATLDVYRIQANTIKFSHPSTSSTNTATSTGPSPAPSSALVLGALLITTTSGQSVGTGIDVADDSLAPHALRVLRSLVEGRETTTDGLFTHTNAGTLIAALQKYMPNLPPDVLLMHRFYESCGWDSSKPYPTRAVTGSSTTAAAVAGSDVGDGDGPPVALASSEQGTSAPAQMSPSPMTETDKEVDIAACPLAPAGLCPFLLAPGVSIGVSLAASIPTAINRKTWLATGRPLEAYPSRMAADIVVVGCLAVYPVQIVDTLVDAEGVHAGTTSHGGSRSEVRVRAKLARLARAVAKGIREYLPSKDEDGDTIGMA